MNIATPINLRQNYTSKTVRVCGALLSHSRVCRSHMVTHMLACGSKLYATQRKYLRAFLETTYTCVTLTAQSCAAVSTAIQGNGCGVHRTILSHVASSSFKCVLNITPGTEYLYFQECVIQVYQMGYLLVLKQDLSSPSKKAPVSTLSLSVLSANILLRSANRKKTVEKSEQFEQMLRSIVSLRGSHLENSFIMDKCLFKSKLPQM